MSRRPGQARVAMATVVIALIISTLAGLLAPAGAAGSVGTSGGRAVVGTGGPPRYRPPLDAPVIDPFRPPAEPWLAGNRGLEYDTVPGTVVGAIGPGLVVFAGAVARELHVTVLHPDGIRSSYSYLASISVSVGDRVRAGDPVGTTGEAFHLGARVGDTYIDPAALFGTMVGRASVYLVPATPGAGSGPAAGDTGRSSGRGAAQARQPASRPGGATRVGLRVAEVAVAVGAAVEAGAREAVAGDPGP